MSNPCCSCYHAKTHIGAHTCVCTERNRPWLHFSHPTFHITSPNASSSPKISTAGTPSITVLTPFWKKNQRRCPGWPQPTPCEWPARDEQDFRLPCSGHLDTRLLFISPWIPSTFTKVVTQTELGARSQVQVWVLIGGNRTLRKTECEVFTTSLPSWPQKRPALSLSLRITSTVLQVGLCTRSRKAQGGELCSDRRGGWEIMERRVVS